MLFLQGKLRKGGRIPRHDPHARQSVQVHLRTPARLEEEIRNERARELFGEFQRKYDLVRWGIWYEAVTDNSDYAYLQLNTANSRIKPCHRYYPIPDTEVTYSKNNLDNNEYKAYGL